MQKNALKNENFTEKIRAFLQGKFRKIHRLFISFVKIIQIKNANEQIKSANYLIKTSGKIKQ